VTAVLAGCGDLGLRVGARLAAGGHPVLGLRRRPELLPAGLGGQAVDLRNEPPRLPAQTAILVVALTADAHTGEAYRETYLTGLSHVLDALERDVPVAPRTVLVSSTAVYAASDGRWVDEDTPARPRTATGAALREAEELILSRAPEAVVLRLAGLYGPGRGRLLPAVAEGTASIPAEPLYTNRIHRDDAAAAITHLATRGPAPEPVYLGVDHQPVERAALLRFLAGELGAPEPPVATGGSSRGHGKRCRGRRLRQTGFTFTHPTYRQGYRALLAAETPTLRGISCRADPARPA
jgi:nucleoside-diphosphate-sugar epimerase